MLGRLDGNGKWRGVCCVAEVKGMMDDVALAASAIEKLPPSGPELERFGDGETICRRGPCELVTIQSAQPFTCIKMVIISLWAFCSLSALEACRWAGIGLLRGSRCAFFWFHLPSSSSIKMVCIQFLGDPLASTRAVLMTCLICLPFIDG